MLSHIWLGGCTALAVISSLLGELLPFGESHGDHRHRPADDACDLQFTHRSLPIFGTLQNTSFVCTNGLISLGQPFTSYTPEPFPLHSTGLIIIAAYWSDLDPRVGGSVYARTVTSGTELHYISDQIRAARGLSSFQATWMLVATWDRVREFNAPHRYDTVTVQAVLITDDVTTFAMFIYGSLEWPVYGSRNAQVGFDGGDGYSYFVVPASNTANIVNMGKGDLISNINVPGRWLFHLTSLNNTCEISSPCGVGGTCLNGPQRTYTCICALGFAPIEVDYKTTCLETKPKVQWRLIDQQIQFFCDVKALNLTAGAEIEFHVDWHVENDTMTETVASHKLMVTELPSVLNEFEWDHHPFGVKISCSIKMNYNNKSDSHSSTVRSEPFYVGVQVVNPSNGMLAVSVDGSYRTIELQPTVPILCKIPSTRECDLHLANFEYPLHEVTNQWTKCASKLVQGNKRNVRFESCGVVIKGIQLVNVTGDSDQVLSDWNSTVAVKIYATRSASYSTAYSAAVRLVPRIDRDHELQRWRSSVNDIRVMITNREQRVAGKVCQSLNDPHIITYDGRSFGLHEEGTYVLYQHVTLPIQVQAMYKRCMSYSSATCNCAVAVKSGENTFVADYCAKRANSAAAETYRVGILGCDDQALEVIVNNDNSYTVSLPSGTLIHIAAPIRYDVLYSTPSVKIEPSSLDWDSVRGICGTLNNDYNDDFRSPNGSIVLDYQAFFRTWKVHDQDNLIKHTYMLTTQSKPEDRPLPATVCDCYMNCTGEVCHSDLTTGDMPVCVPISSGRECENSIVNQRNQVIRFCHDRHLWNPSQNDFNIFQLEFEYDAERPSDGAGFSWNGAWNESSARSFCENLLLNNSAIRQCLQVVQLSTDFSVQGCIEDIKAAGSTVFSRANVESLQEDCLREIYKNETLWEPSSSNGTEMVPPRFLTDLICPNLCNNNGVCINGSCVCDQQWVGTSCSSNKFTAPEFVSDARGGICNITQLECENFILFGRGFSSDIGNGTCEVTSYRVKISGDRVFMDKSTTPLRVVNTGTAVCTVPSLVSNVTDNETFSYKIRVSNNGYNFSNDIHVVLVNSSCMMCEPEVKMNCQHIGRCPKQVSESPNSNNSLYIGIGVGAAALVTAVIIFIKVGHQRKRKYAARSQAAENPAYMGDAMND